MNIKTKIARKENYGSKRSTSNIKYIVIHYTANDGDSDEGNTNYFKNNIVKASAHYFVDSDSITQSVPDNYVAYSVGAKSYKHKECRNSNSISIELCDDVKNGSIYPTKATINKAIELTKELMKKYNVPASKVIRHYDVTGKLCPKYWVDNKKWESEFHSKLTGNSVNNSKEKFIEDIAKSVNKYREQFGICVASPIIAQACLESAYGTSDKAKYHNYFGLKYRKNRVTCNNGTFNAGSMEQNKDGSYVPISTDWYSFESVDKGVLGYFQFLNTERYSNLKGITDAKKYLELLKNDGYATSINYVDNVYKVIKDWNLTKYDTKSKPVETKTFKVRVSINNLNIRKGAGLSYKSVGVCPKGVFTIIETKTKDGYEWGKLKSGLGWIALKFTTKE